MPTVRYLIRNEYGLSDSDLYQLADKDDPEAVLEGVAMAGLVGVLRQLGDLAEFAAKIFHDLHEEVTSTGARGHGLMLRVQQLEAEFPSIEKGLLVQSSHSQFAYNDGMDWHTNLRTDQNLITQGDMPRFVLDSYEESRGPPRLFMLDKFDVAGAGACLKRYSDPSFFKVDYASTGKMEEEMHMEIKHTKIKKKAHWKKGESIESFLAPLINSNLQPDQVSAKVPFRRVKLKCRKLLDSDIASKKSYMEQFLEACSTEEKVWPQNFASHPPEIIKTIDSAQFIPQAYGTIVKNINDSSTVRKINLSQSPKRKEKTVDNDSKFMNQPEIESKGNLKYYAIEDEYSSDETKKSVIENIQASINKSLANSNSSPDHEYGEPDDIGSDLENYVDALNTIESEVERDTKNKIMPHQNLELDTTDFVTWDQKQHTETSPSKERDSMIEVERSPSNSGMSNDPTDTRDFSKPEMPNITLDEVLDNGKVEEYTLSNHLLLNWGSTYETDMTSKDHSNIEVEHSPSNSDISNDPTEKQKYLKPEMPDKTDNEVQGNNKVNEHALSNHLLLNWGSTNEAVIASKDNVEDQCSIEDTLVSGDCKVVEPSSFANNTMNFNKSIPLSEAKESYTARDHSSDSVGDNEYVEGRVFNHILQTMYQNNNENIHMQLLGDSAVETIESSLGRVSLSDSGNDDEYLEGKDFDHISETTYSNDNVDIHVQPLEESTADLVKETQASVNGIQQPISLAEASNDDTWRPWEVPHTDDAVSTEPVKDSSKLLSDNLLLLPDTHGSHFIKDVEATISSGTEMKEENVYEDVLNEHIEDSNVQQDSLPDTREQNNKTCVDAITQDNIFTVVEGNAVEDNNDNIGGTYNEMAEDVIKVTKPDINIDGTKEFNDQLLPGIIMASTGKLQLPSANSSENDRHNNNSVDDVNPFESENFSYAEEPTESLEANLGPVDLLDSTNFIYSGEMQSHNELSSCTVDSGAENQKENMFMESPIEEPLDGLQDEKPSIVTSTDTEILEDHLPIDNVNMESQNDMQVGSNDGLVVTSNEVEGPKESPDENPTKQLPFYSTSRISEEEYQRKELSCTLIGENKSDSGTSELAGCKLVKQADNDSLDEYVIVDSDDNNRSTHSDENNRSTHSEYSVDDARFEIKLEENYMPCDAVLSRHCTEDAESCDPNNLDPLNTCEPQPSMMSSNESPVENLIGPDNSPTEPDYGNENSTENEQDSSLEKVENQENNHFVVLDRQLERPCIGSNNLTVCQNAMEQVSKPEHFGYFEVDNIRSNPELSILENAGLPSTVNSSLQDSDEIPPLPPLPPIEWIGNFRLVPQSLTNDTNQHTVNDTIQHTVNDTIQPTDATDSIIVQTMSDEKHSQANDVDKKINDQFSKEDLDASSSSVQEATHAEDQTIKHGLHKRPQLAQLLPTFKLEISQHEASSSAGDPVMPVNPYFVGPCTEEWRHQYGYGFYGSESVQNLNLPPYGFLYPIGGDASAVFNYMIPTIDGENSNLKYRSIRDRPRDPLIEAVAAHDKSKLRKVSELDLPSTKPKEDDRNSLLEEIKNKSFNLKPANAIKPNFKGVPPANLKVAAILEKANAIRKACAESDEEDCDSWSDS